jgi:hypothetical protein
MASQGFRCNFRFLGALYYLMFLLMLGKRDDKKAWARSMGLSHEDLDIEQEFYISRTELGMGQHNQLEI